MDEIADTLTIADLASGRPRWPLLGRNSPEKRDRVTWDNGISHSAPLAGSNDEGLS
jgi:hypothetical protein